jgi:hypothetical protein
MPRPQTPPATPRARAFYLTHAYVFALEAGDPRAAALKARLVAEGADRRTDPAFIFPQIRKGNAGRRRRVPPV